MGLPKNGVIPHDETNQKLVTCMNETITAYLNASVWAKLAPSPIHGIGVFAIRDIPKGQKIYTMALERKPLILTEWSQVEPEIRELIWQRWAFAAEGEMFMSPNDDAHIPSFLNHSDTPNLDKLTFETLNDVSAGEELTEDYGIYKLKMV